MDKKRFLFYTSWKKNIALMDDVELRRFINNLINYTEGGAVDLPTRVDQVIWNDVVEILNHNETKREAAAKRSKENGAKGGRPNNPTGSNETHNNPMGLSKPKEPDKSKELSVKREELNVKSSMLSVIRQEWDNLVDKKLSLGWNSLSVQEAARYFELEKELK